jgi:hypothetical protein
MNATQIMNESFQTLLPAARRSPEIPESADAYGWLVGSWELDVLQYRGIDLSSQGIKGEAHFGWVLEGRAIQDVWIMPRPSERNPNSDRTNNMYGHHAPRLGSGNSRLAHPVAESAERS